MVAVAHRPQPLGDAVEEARPTAQVVDVGLGRLVVGLDENLFVAECGQCGLRRQENSGELSCIARHALLVEKPGASGFDAANSGPILSPLSYQIGIQYIILLQNK